MLSTSYTQLIFAIFLSAHAVLFPCSIQNIRGNIACKQVKGQMANLAYPGTGIVRVYYAITPKMSIIMKFAHHYKLFFY